MRKSFLALLMGALVVVLSVGVGGSIAGSGATTSNDPAAVRATDNLASPLGKKQDALRAVGLGLKLKGKIAKDAKVAKLGKGNAGGKSKYVELAREGEDSIWTVLGEFGGDGPLHNQIPAPDRKVDNTTIWTPDFGRDHYLDILFSEGSGESTMRNFYLEQSSGRYTVNGDVTDWVQVPNDEAYYGNDGCGSIVCQDTWEFVNDSVDDWASTMSTADANAYLARFDVWDRYDHDGDGDFNEPDGYIDHFQSVHAGVGQETGGGAQGTDAIWSHRWYAYFAGNGPDGTGPASFPAGGVRIGDTNYWIGDYTIEPENGGVGVFSHEFAHDLGLPDEYDTSGNTGGAENSTAWWTLMSQGSYGTDGKEDLGTEPTHMNAWDKFQLGWLNYKAVFPGQPASQVLLGPAEYNTDKTQALIAVLPDKTVTINVGTPYEGSKFYYSGNGNNLDNFMTKEVTLGSTPTPTLTAKVLYDIELDWDYAYVVVSTDGGTSWTGVPTNLSSSSNPNSQNFGNGITGSSNGQWVDLNADLSAYANQTVLVGFRYWTDVATVEPGISIDNISIDGGAVDGAETDAGWTFDPTTGFHATTGTEQISGYFNAYVAENRTYSGFDDSLRTGPYQFGWLNDPTKQDLVEHFPYQDGLLVWYWDTSQSDNNVGEHPGAGLILPVDANPAPLHWSDGSVMRPRLQAFDSTFTTKKIKKVTLHQNGVATAIPPRNGVSVFDDMQSYWVSGDPGDNPNGGRYQAEWSSVNVPKTGTKIGVISNSNNGNMLVEVQPAP